MFRPFLLFVCLLLTALLTAQTSVPCGTTFYDSGGAGGNYPDDANEVFTICPTNPGDVAKVSFSAVVLEECCDFLQVFNGDNQVDLLGDVTTGGQFFLSTAADGCLTVVLTSDGSVTEAGFTATATCGPPPTCPQPSDLNLVARTTTSAELSWTENGTATLYDVFIVPAGSPLPGGAPDYDDVSLPFTATGLTAGNFYDAYVRADCDGAAGTDDSDFTGPLTFQTVPPPPANDDCGDATMLTVSPDDNCANEVTGVALESATASNPVTACGSLDDADVWFAFQPAGTSVVADLIDPAQGEGPFLGMEVYAGSCGSLTSLSCGENEVRLTGLTPASTYFIRIYGNENAVFDLCVYAQPEPPVNDACGGAVALAVSTTPVCASTVAATTAGATESLAACGAAAADDDVWFSFTAANDVHLLYLTDVDNATGFGRDMLYEVFSGSCGSLTSVYCGPIFFSFDNPPVTLPGLSPGTDYFLRVYTEDITGTVNFNICLATPPLNDECSGAFSLPVNPTAACNDVVAASTIGATQSEDDCGIASADDDIWFTFVATAVAHNLQVNNVVFTGGFNQTIHYELIEGNSCGTGTVLECNQFSNDRRKPLQNLTIGQKYYVRIFTRISNANASFDVCLTTPPPNDECVNAVSVPVNPDYSGTLRVSGTTLGGTQSDVLSSGLGCSATANMDDVWYQFTALAETHRLKPENITVAFPNPASSRTIILRVYSGADCGTLTELSCDFITAGNFDFMDVGGLTSGETYFIRLYSQDFTAELDFDLVIQTDPALPVNLLSFRGEAADKANVFRWNTASESNSAWHILERSTDGVADWTEVARTQGAGESLTEQAYEAADYFPLAMAYYRLRLLDFDGQQAFSEVISLERSDVATKSQVFPNPARDNFYVRLSGKFSGSTGCSLYSSEGRLLKTWPAADVTGHNTRSFQVPDLPPGVYIVRLLSDTGETEVVRLVLR